MASLTFVVTHACSFENVSFSSYGICRVNSNFFGFLKNKSVIVWLIDIISFHKDASLKMYLLMSHLKSDLSPPCLPFPVNAFFLKKLFFVRSEDCIITSQNYWLWSFTLKHLTWVIQIKWKNPHYKNVVLCVVCGKWNFPSFLISLFTLLERYVKISIRG